MEERIKGLILAGSGLIIFGAIGIFVKHMQFSVPIILFFFNLFGALGAFIIMKHRKHKNYIGSKKALLLLIVFALMNDFFFWTSYKLTTVANTILSHYTMPIFLVILAPFLLKEKFKSIYIISILLSFTGLGIMLLQGLDFTNLAGIMFGVASGIMYALLIIYYKKTLRNNSVYVVNFYRFLISIIILLPIFLLEGPAFTTSDVMPIIAFGTIFAIIATSLHINGIKRLKANEAGIIGYVEPLASITFGVVLLSQVPTLSTLIGGTLILTGTYLVIRST